MARMGDHGEDEVTMRDSLNDHGTNSLIGFVKGNEKGDSEPLLDPKQPQPLTKNVWTKDKQGVRRSNQRLFQSMCSGDLL